MTSYHPISCDQARQALSARLDGESSGVPADQLDAHVDRCAGCAAWLTRAEQATRLVRLQPAQVPDLTATILAAIAADRDAQAALVAARAASVADPAAGRDVRPALAVGRDAQAALAAGPAALAAAQESRGHRPFLQRLLQAAMAMIAAVELVLVLPVMLGSGVDGHAHREAGAFAVAITVAFLLAAFQPRLARAYTPFALVLAVCLTAASGLDIGHQRVGIVEELVGHFGTLVLAGLLWGVGRLQRDWVPGDPDANGGDRTPRAPAGAPA